MSSEGKSSAGSKSTPIKSRIVFPYSVRFSRRTVTRPGFGGAFGSTQFRRASTAPANLSRSACASGVFASFGGISCVWSMRTTSFQSLRFSRSEASVL